MWAASGDMDILFALTGKLLSFKLRLAEGGASFLHPLKVLDRHYASLPPSNRVHLPALYCHRGICAALPLRSPPSPWTPRPSFGNPSTAAAKSAGALLIPRDSALLGAWTESVAALNVSHSF